MSLFGDDIDTPAARAKSSLFDDDQPTAKTSSSMFGDSTADDNDSPWGFTPKKNTGRGNLVRSLLADADVPDLYIDTWDAWQLGGSVNASQCRQLLKNSKIRAADQDRIWTIVSSGGQVSALGRSELNVLLALIGLAQEGEELSLDAVDERRRKLPVPSLTFAAPQEPAPSQQPPTPSRQVQSSAPATPRQNGTRKPSFGAGFESDPWASPELYKGHNHANGVGISGPHRTTSNFSSSAAAPADVSSGGGAFANAPQPSTSEGSGWGGPSGLGGVNPSSGFGAGGISGDGFGEDGNGSAPPRRAAPPRVTTSTGQEEVVTVNILDEKEGMFMFQHRNYEVNSVRRNSKVIRRYSDFVWLLDCLHKRYPFRQLPLLPPKRVAINGNHIAADTTFLEKRRRGLARFANSLVRHPILREEQLVIMFLTVPTELSVWRKQATISVQEEFVGKALPPSLEDSLPQNLMDTFDTARSGIRRSAELYINLCNITERLVKRKEALAGEYNRFSMNLTSLSEVSSSTYAMDQNEVPLLNEGLYGTAKHINTSRNLLEDEARAWDEGILEDLKTMRDSHVSMRDMFDRRDRYSKDNIPQLEKRIQQNEQKLITIKAKGPAAKPGEAEKVENAIVNDKQSIVDQHARGVLIKECIRDELVIFQSSIAQISHLHQDWAQERVKYSELQADNFRSMADAVDGMPLGD
ncbi:Sorting nexin mvp1 [Acrodontium crateriforme]|uniref:Sorting nexin MVP1 n=1 Tax=Acrodontium crateriforme TaxID=150365 RepID=A0AAQ3M1N3_9PEZI|nr:Sorting nexin mvp1 [Acrodontium crateriforme]